MRILVTAQSLAGLSGPVVVVPLFEKARRLPPEFRGMSAAFTSTIQGILTADEFTGKSGQIQMVYPLADSPYRRALLIGLGDRRKFDADKVRETLGRIVQTAAKHKIDAVTIPVISGPGVDARVFGQAAAEGAELANFQFTDYLTDEDDIRHKVGEIFIASGDRQKSRRVEAGVGAGQSIASAVNTSRRLVMTPGNALYPETLAKEAVKLSKGLGIKTEVLNSETIKRLKMGGVWNVGKGSDHLPRVIVMQYTGNKRKKAVDVCLVGKGVTFDTGGISLKPNARMTEMIGDMMGAATVLGATLGAAALNLPLNLVTIIPTVENMPSGQAYRPGDIITTMSGQTVEIISTDAEGRLILADGLTYADRFSPSALIDVATLTGGVEIALGNQAAALMGNDSGVVNKLRQASKKSAERVWELPMFDEYAEQIKSDVADMKNSGGRMASTIVAGWFLRKYVDDHKWAHLDIAAMDWETKGKPYIPKGCTGFGVRLLIQFLADWK